MTDRPVDLGDVTIESALARRAPHGPDGDLLAEIVYAAGMTAQDRSLWTLRPRARVVLVLVALALAMGLTLGVWIAGGHDNQRPSLTVTATTQPTPAVSSAPSPRVTPSSAPTGACTTDAVRFLTGEAVSGSRAESVAPDLPGLGGGRGVFITSTGGQPSEIWTVGDGNSTPRRVAKVEGSGVNLMDLDDFAADGSLVLVRLGQISPSGASPECVDLYALPTDGSAALRVTAVDPGTIVTGAALSPDGRLVAYTTWSGPGGGTTLRVRGLPGGPPIELARCEGFSDYSEEIAWSPDGAWLAVDCGDRVRVVSATSGPDMPLKPAVGIVVALKWIDPERIRVASAPSGSAYAGIQIQDFNADHTALVDQHALDDLGFEVVTGPIIGGFSADAGHLLMEGIPAPGSGATVPPGDDRLYVVSSDGLEPASALPEGARDASWSSSSSAVYVTSGAAPILTRVDVATMRGVEIGPVADGYRQGLWEWPR